jgi:signal transduction histidine kinase
MSDPSLKKYKEDLDVIVGQIEKISQITNSILKHSRKLPREFIEVDIASVIDESLKILLPLFKKNNIELEKKYSKSNLKVYGNTQQLEQVMLNLINNGIDALGSNGRITISLHESEEGEVIVKIRDNGCGIDTSKLDSIFTPFYTTKPPDKGTGLGLYIVKNICKNHNAEISVESSEGKGTEFRLIFPNRGESHA